MLPSCDNVSISGSAALLYDVEDVVCSAALLCDVEDVVASAAPSCGIAVLDGICSITTTNTLINISTVKLNNELIFQKENDPFLRKARIKSQPFILASSGNNHSSLDKPVSDHTPSPSSF
ncbi:hypothetical protein JTE90_017079 [Oedothorax gibbosus]|uniref:Uncharacterized protein n=1 Tax=Oedothorax gibbosus TaxID=931172 RepID=A0AAV6UMV4_9ARAC|nr:hypothetical protein JTE90_017079 [Oedothorax gibbosus]